MNREKFGSCPKVQISGIEKKLWNTQISSLQKKENKENLLPKNSKKGSGKKGKQYRASILEKPEEEGQEPPDPAAALAAFEAWYQGARGTPFWILFETYMPETPVVDF